MIRSILVPLDGSSFGEHALPLAMGIARRAKAKMHIVLVHEPDASVESLSLEDTLDHDQRQKEAGYLKELRGRLRHTEDLKFEIHHAAGLISNTLEQEARSRDADLVVLSTHGRGPLSRLWLGSVADELVRRLTIPALVIRPQENSVVLDHARTFRHMLVPLDGTSHAEAVLDPAIKLAKLMDAEITLLQAVDTPVKAGVSVAAASLTAVVEEKARQYLKTISERCLQRHIRRVQTMVMAGASPAAIILDSAHHLDCDLIAIGTRGQGGVRRLLLGSCADKVLRAASVPVLVLRALD